MTHRNRTVTRLAALLFAALAASPLSAGDAGLVSTMELMAAVSEHDGVRVVLANDVPSQRYTGDFAPPQVLEIIRPDQGPVTVGRLATSCTCLSASIPKRTFAKGERILIEVRNVKATPPGGATYAIFVQLTNPVKTTLEYDMFVQSQPQPIQAAPAPASTPAPAPKAAAPKAAAPAPTAAAPSPRAAVPAPAAPQHYPAESLGEEILVVEGEPVVVSRTITITEHPPIKAPPFTFEDLAPYAPKSRAAAPTAPVEKPEEEADAGEKK